MSGKRYIEQFKVEAVKQITEVSIASYTGCPRSCTGKTYPSPVFWSTKSGHNF